MPHSRAYKTKITQQSPETAYVYATSGLMCHIWVICSYSEAKTRRFLASAIYIQEITTLPPEGKLANIHLDEISGSLTQP